jgi:hypothetical protein
MGRRVNLSKQAERIIARLDNSGLLRAMNKTVAEVRDHIKRRYMGGARTSPNRLARNTGAMERHTVATRAEKAGDQSIKAAIKVNVPYASIHFSDHGQKQTVIKPRTVTKLTVPILKNAQHRAPLPAKGYPSRFAYHDILYASKKGKFIFPIFALRSSVTVPSRIDISRDVLPYAREILEREVKHELRTFNR